MTATALADSSTTSKLVLTSQQTGLSFKMTLTDDTNGYRQLGLTDLPLFHGIGDMLGIGVQVMVTGVAPGVPLRDYASQIIFTVRP